MIRTGTFSDGTFASWLRWGVIILFIPVMMFLFLHISNESQQFSFLIYAACFLFFSHILCVFERQFNRCVSAETQLICFVSWVFLVISIWNVSYLYYIGASGFRLDVFREPVRTFHAPLYGLSQDALASQYYYITAVLFIFILSWIFLLPRLAKIQARMLIFFLHFILLLAFSFSDGWLRLEKSTVHFATFSEGLRFFKSIPDLLSYFVPTMGKMGEHNNHYPPGNLMLLFAESRFGSSRLLVPFLMLITCSTTFVVGKTTQLMGWNLQQQLFTQGLFISVSGVLIFTSIDFSAVPVFFFASGVYLYLRYLAKGEWITVWLSGINLALFLFFSFVVSLLLLFVVIHQTILLYTKKTKLDEVIKFILPVVLVVFLSYLILYLLSGFNMAKCFTEALHQSQSLLKSSSFDDPYRYLIRSTGNLLGFVCGSGMICFALVVVVLIRNGFAFRDYMDKNLLPFSVLLTILTASFSGLFYMETERVWTCLLPVMVLGGGCSFPYFSEMGRTVLIISAIFTASVLELNWSQI